MNASKKSWSWSNDQPVGIVVVLLVVFFALFFPNSACKDAVVDSPASTDSQ